MKAELDRIRRETRDMKATETQVQAAMKREEEKQRAAEKERDQHEIMAWRKQQRDETVAFGTDRSMSQKAEDLENNREYQSYKRSLKEGDQDQMLQDIHNSYAEAKEDAAYNTDLKRIELAERQRAPIEENLEKYRTMAEAKGQERQRDDIETIEKRLTQEQFELEHRMMLARQDRDDAVQSLEFIRTHQFQPVPEGQDLTSRVARAAH